MKITYKLLLFLCTNFIYSQDALRYRTDLNIQELTKKRNTTLTTKPNEQHYTNNSYIFGYLYYKEKKTDQEYYLRYNAFKDLIEISQGKESPEIVLKDSDISCIIGIKKYIYINNNPAIKKGYLELIYSNKENGLYAREKLIYKKAIKAITSLTPDIPAKYIRLKSYYVLSSNKELIKEIPSKRKGFIKSFIKIKQKKIKSFIRKNKIDLDNNSHVIKVYKFALNL